MHISLILLKLTMGRHLNGFYHLWLWVYIPSWAGIWDWSDLFCNSTFFCPHADGWIATGYPVWSQTLSIISGNWACCKRCSAYYARFFRGQSEMHKIVHHAKFPLYYIEFISNTHAHMHTAILDTTNWQLFLMASFKILLRFYICKFLLASRQGGIEVDH